MGLVSWYLYHGGLYICHILIYNIHIQYYIFLSYLYNIHIQYYISLLHLYNIVYGYCIFIAVFFYLFNFSYFNDTDDVAQYYDTYIWVIFMGRRILFYKVKCLFTPYLPAFLERVLAGCFYGSPDAVLWGKMPIYPLPPPPPH